MKKNGFTIVEVLAIMIILGLVIVVGAPIVVGVIEDAKESHRKSQLEAFAKEVGNAYLLVLTNDNLYAFDSYEKGGITSNNTINFTNKWIDDNVSVNNGNVNCKNETIGTDEETLSNVYFYLNSGMIELKNCTIGDISGYNYINGKVVKE